MTVGPDLDGVLRVLHPVGGDDDGLADVEESGHWVEERIEKWFGVTGVEVFGGLVQHTMGESP